MALEGDLSIFRLPDILQVIAQQGKTGILTVQGESDILAVSFHQGKVVAADALNQSFEEMLGEVLASQGVLSPDRFNRYSEEHRTTAGERLADFLIRRGALTREQLLSALRFQTYRLLLEVLRWSQGEFKFYSGDEVAFEEGMEPLAVDEVLFRSMRDLLGEGTVAGAMPHGFVAYERVPSSRPLRVAREGMEPSEREADVIWISPDEHTILDELDGRTMAQEIAEKTGLGDVRAQYALFHLLRSGLVRPAAERPAPEPPAAEPPAAERPAAERPALVRTEIDRAAVGPQAHVQESLAREEAPRRPVAVPRRFELEAEEEVAEPAPTSAGLLRAVSALAVAVGAAALAVALLRPALLLLPFPAQAEARQGLERVERRARFASIDRAARAFYLLEGRYPASLEDLVERGLLERRQRFDARGGALAYRPREDAYTLGPARDEEGDDTVSESVSGDVLLDRTMFAAVQAETEIPLVLLD